MTSARVLCPACHGRNTTCPECRGDGRVSPERARAFYAFETLLVEATRPYHRGRIQPLAEQPTEESESYV